MSRFKLGLTQFKSSLAIRKGIISSAWPIFFREILMTQIVTVLVAVILSLELASVAGTVAIIR